MKVHYSKVITINAIRCAVILLFSYTAITKWLSYDDFLFQLHQSPFIHSGYTLVSIVLPATELGISFLLVLSATGKIALLCAAILLFVFTIYIICMLLFAPSIPCSCGGFISSLSWSQHIWLNAVMMLLCVWGYHLQAKNRSIGADRLKILLQ